MRRTIVLASTLSVLLAVVTPPADASFPGSNGKIAFTSYPRGIGVVNPNGTGLRFLTDHAYDYGPSWSSDGTKIVFAVYPPTGIPKIATMAADGTGRTVVFEAPPYVKYIDRQVWSPDGTKIVFSADVSGHFDSHIFIMNADGSSRTNISGDHNHDYFPDWSPDGNKIAFAADPPKGPLMIMNTDGTGRKIVVNNANWPSWSPDGATIAFHRNGGGQAEIYVADSDGSNVTELTDTPNRVESVPAFSPDGTRVAFLRTTEPDRYSSEDIWSVAVASLRLTRITDSRRDEYQIAWQPLPP